MYITHLKPTPSTQSQTYSPIIVHIWLYVFQLSERIQQHILTFWCIYHITIWSGNMLANITIVLVDYVLYLLKPRTEIFVWKKSNTPSPIDLSCVIERNIRIVSLKACYFPFDEARATHHAQLSKNLIQLFTFNWSIYIFKRINNQTKSTKSIHSSLCMISYHVICTNYIEYLTHFFHSDNVSIVCVHVWLISKRKQ